MERLFNDPAVPLRLVAFAAESLDDPNTREGLLEDRVRLTERLLRLPADASEPAAEEAPEQRDRRQHGHDHQAESPVGEQHDGHAADEHHSLAEHAEQVVRDACLYERRIARHARHKLAGLALVEVGEREPGHVAEQRRPYIGNHALAHVREQVRLEVSEDGLHHEQQHERGRHHVE